MSSPERLTEPEAYVEAEIMQRAFRCQPGHPAIRYDFASLQITHIKHTLATLTDESLLHLHGDSAKLMEENESDDVWDATEILEDALRTLPYLDKERAVRIYTLALEREDIDELTVTGVPFGLEHLTRVAGDEALPVWKMAFGHNHHVQEYATIVARTVLERAIEYPLSIEAATELSQLAEPLA